ncbi:MAG: Lar protein [Thermoproteota archaeon]|nr:Lar protein [Thermoproteota archaeon]
MRIKIPYGRSSIALDIDEKQLIGLFRPVDVKDVKETEKMLSNSIENPIEGRSLSNFVFQGKKVAVAVDDITRVTPLRMILPILLEKIEAAGVRKSSIKIVIALGTHRSMTDREIRDRYGAEIVEEYSIINHECHDSKELLSMGKLPGDVPILINKHFMKADVRIGVGNIIPHFTAGWSGGSKILLPGLAGEETVAGMHYYGAKTIPNALGEYENKPRAVMDTFAETVGLHMIVNTVLTRGGKIAGVYSGDFVKAHRRGVQHSRRLYGIAIPSLADITVSGSYPADIDFWQAEKALYSASLSTRRGGGILLITPCPEGISSTHKEWADLLAYNSEELEETIESKKVDDLTAASLALCVAKTREPFTVCICSDGISDKEADKLHFKKFDNPKEALKFLDGKLDKSTKKLVLTHGGDTYPILREN